MSPNNFEKLSGGAKDTEKDEEIKKRRWAGAMLCRALQRGLGCHGTSKDRWTRRPEKSCARRPPGGRDTNNCGSESPCPLTLCGIGQLSTEGLNPLLCERHATPPCPPPQGAGVPCREKGHKRVLHTARPSADVTVIIIIPLPQMAWLPPSPPARRPLSAVPRDVKGPQAPGFLPGLSVGQPPAHSVFLQVQGPK